MFFLSLLNVTPLVLPSCKNKTIFHVTCLQTPNQNMTTNKLSPAINSILVLFSIFFCPCDAHSSRLCAGCLLHLHRTDGLCPLHFPSQLFILYLHVTECVFKLFSNAPYVGNGIHRMFCCNYNHSHS